MEAITRLASPLSPLWKWTLRLTWWEFASFTALYYAILGHVLLTLWQYGVI